MTGISRVHGALVAPKNFAGVALQDFTVTFAAADAAAVAADYNSGVAVGEPGGVWGKTVANGAFDQVFRTAASLFASISRVGTLDGVAIRFAVESLGFEGENNGEGFLGTGPDNEAGTVTTTAGALQAAIRALGTVNGVDLTKVTVAKFAY